MPNPAVDVGMLLKKFPHRDISACITNTASLGDSMASHRLVIVGKLATDTPSPTLYLSPIDTAPSSAISHHINSNLNEDCFSIARVSKSTWDLADYNRSGLLPCPLAMASDTHSTSGDIMLHPNYPGMEGEFRDAPNMDRTTFLIPYISQDGKCWCMRPLSCGE